MIILFIYMAIDPGCVFDSLPCNRTDTDLQWLRSMGTGAGRYGIGEVLNSTNPLRYVSPTQVALALCDCNLIWYQFIDVIPSSSRRTTGWLCASLQTTVRFIPLVNISILLMNVFCSRPLGVPLS